MRRFRIIFKISSLLFLFLTAERVGADPNFEYICIMPGDRIFLTAPMIELAGPVESLKEEYEGDKLFKFKKGEERDSWVDRWVFTPQKDLSVHIEADDYEDEVIFDGVRFLQADGRLYTWISLRGGPVNGVIHRIVFSVEYHGRVIRREIPISVDVRRTLRACN
ncbi:hypothetical protein GW915_00705 [bacterium]|nr:hypothetical protein [bacterium]